MTHHILHIDTSGEQAVVALASDGILRAMRISEVAKNHASVINRLVEEILGESGVHMSDLSAISVIGGPGSYTGLRIGLSTAKGYCYVCDIPLILHNKLDILALQTRKAHPAGFDYYGAILPARQSEYYFVLHDKTGACLTPPTHIFEDKLQDMLRKKGGEILIGGIYNKAIQNIGGIDNVQLVDNESIDVNTWTEEAQKAYDCNEFVNLSTCEPYYLKQVYTHNKL